MTLPGNYSIVTDAYTEPRQGAIDETLIPAPRSVPTPYYDFGTLKKNLQGFSARLPAGMFPFCSYLSRESIGLQAGVSSIVQSSNRSR